MPSALPRMISESVKPVLAGRLTPQAAQVFRASMINFRAGVITGQAAHIWRPAHCFVPVGFIPPLAQIAAKAWPG